MTRRSRGEQNGRELRRQNKTTGKGGKEGKREGFRAVEIPGKTAKEI